QRQRSMERVEMGRRDDVEPLKVHGRDTNRLALVDRDSDVDRVVLVVELDVEACDTGIGKAAVRVERLDSLQIRVESAAVEESSLLLPRYMDIEEGQFGVFACRENGLQRIDIDRMRTLDLQRADGNRPFVFTRDRRRNEDNDDTQPQTAHGRNIEP